MGVVRRHRRLFGVLAILALVANVVAGVLCHMPAKASVIIDDVLGVITLCTADGSGTVQHGGSAPDQSRKADGSCTFCTVLKTLAVAVALAFAAIAFPLIVPAAPPVQVVRTLADHLSLGAIRSRARKLLREHYPSFDSNGYKR